MPRNDDMTQSVAEGCGRIAAHVRAVRMPPLHVPRPMHGSWFAGYDAEVAQPTVEAALASYVRTLKRRPAVNG